MSDASPGDRTSSASVVDEAADKALSKLFERDARAFDDLEPFVDDLLAALDSRQRDSVPFAAVL